MKSFLSYLTEEAAVALTTRHNMVHFQDMKPIEFIEWMRKIDSVLHGKLHNIKVTAKVDGLGARFGKSSGGKIFFEGSRTGPVFDAGAFHRYAASKGNNVEIIARADHYDDILRIFQSADFMDAVPNDRKVVCEIFYTPMAKRTENGIVFVTVEYDPSKLGSLMTIVPYGVQIASTGQKAPDEAIIMKNLMKLSTRKIKFMSANLKMGTIDVKAFIDPIRNLDAEAIRVLSSRKAADKAARANVLMVVNTVKEELAEYLLENPEIIGKFKFGPNMEGIVLHLDGKTYKITTPEFKKAIAAKKAAYQNAKTRIQS